MRFTDDTRVSLVTGGCVLALAIVSKYFLRVQLDFVSQYGPVWMLIAYISTRDKNRRPAKWDAPLFWSLYIITITLAIIALYAL